MKDQNVRVVTGVALQTKGCLRCRIVSRIGPLEGSETTRGREFQGRCERYSSGRFLLEITGPVRATPMPKKNKGHTITADTRAGTKRGRFLKGGGEGLDHDGCQNISEGGM